MTDGAFPTGELPNIVNPSFSSVFAENLVGLGFLYSVSYIKPIPTQEKIFAAGKSGPNATFNLLRSILIGLGWVGLGLGSSSVL